MQLSLMDGLFIYLAFFIHYMRTMLVILLNIINIERKKKRNNVKVKNLGLVYHSTLIYNLYPKF